MAINLFCFPYAGGSASFYVKWINKLPDHINVIPVELAGRGRRTGEPLYKTFDELIDDIYPKIKKRAANEKFAFFGFSMGSLIAYEIYSRLKRDGVSLPEHLFLVGREAPNSEINKVHHLNDKEFIDEIYSYDGMPKELYDNKDLVNYFMPVLRADFKIHETYQHPVVPKKIDSKITLWFGLNDKSIIQTNVYKWIDFAGGEIEIIPYKGGHFFGKSVEADILERISQELNEQEILKTTNSICY